MGLLIVAAVAFEAEPSLKLLRTWDPSVEFFELGIGPLNAARSAERLKEVCRSRSVLYLGSCGSFYPFHSVHLVTADSVVWMPPCLRTGIAGFPEHVHPPVSLKAPVLSLPAKTVLTTASISLTEDFSPERERQLPSRDLLVENMELYACIDALQEAKALHIILGVSNAVGREGRVQWAANFQHLAQHTADYLETQREFCEGLLKN